MIYSDRNLAQKLERTEGSANAAFVEARAKLHPESGAACFAAGGANAMFDGLESPLTQTFGLGIFEDATNEVLDKIEAFYRTRGAPVFHEVSPMADPSLLPLLNERGYQPIELTSVLFRPIENDFVAALNPKIKTRIIESGEEELWARTAADGWSTEAPGLSDFMFDFGKIIARSAIPFLAQFDAEQEIGAAVLFIQNDVALLAGASTVPEHRRQGAQAALFEARLRYAAAQGCKIAMMGASPGSQSQRNAEKQGFRIAYTRIKWQLK